MYAAKGYKTAEISKPKQYSGDIYYIEVNLPDGRVVLPISEGQQQCEILLAIVMPDYGSGWDSSNDFSAKDLGKTAKGTDGSAVGVVTPYVPVYVNGKLYYGEEPDGTKADGLGGTGSDTPRPTTTTVTKPITTTTTTATTTVTSKGSTTTTTVTDANTTATTTVTTTATTIVSEVTTTTNGGAASGPNDEPDGILYGDANCDRNVDMSDVVLIMQSLANPNKYGINGTDKNHLTELGSNQADVDRAVEGVTSNDALFIQEYLLHKRANLFPSVK
jgi:hypothetical protein